MCFCFWDCLSFFLWFLFVIICLKWQMKPWGQIPIFCWTSSKFSKNHQMWTLVPLIYYQNSLKHTRTSQIISSIFYIPQHFGNPNISIVWKVRDLTHLKVRGLKSSKNICLMGPKRLVSPSALNKNGRARFWNLDTSLKSENLQNGSKSHLNKHISKIY